MGDHVLALKCLNHDGSGVYLIHPEYVCTVHAGKPASRFTMDPVPRSGKGSQVRGKAAGKAVVRALPSSAAVHQLAMWSVGQQLLGALRMPTGEWCELASMRALGSRSVGRAVAFATSPLTAACVHGSAYRVALLRWWGASRKLDTAGRCRYAGMTNFHWHSRLATGYRCVNSV